MIKARNRKRGYVMAIRAVAWLVFVSSAMLLATVSAMAQIETCVRTVCRPQPPTCTEQCLFITEPPTCRTVCTPNPPECFDQIFPCPSPTTDILPGFSDILTPPEDNGPDACATILVAPGFLCVAGPGGTPEIVPIVQDPGDDSTPPDPGACARMTVPEDHECVIDNSTGQPRIVPRVDMTPQDPEHGNNPCAAYVVPLGYECVIGPGGLPQIVPTTDPEPEPEEIPIYCTLISVSPGFECFQTGAGLRVVPLGISVGDHGLHVDMDPCDGLDGPARAVCRVSTGGHAVLDNMDWLTENSNDIRLPDCNDSNDQFGVICAETR